jgi:mannosyltransferase OCH1-like enzyme
MVTTTLFGAAGIEFIYILTIYYTGALIVSAILLIITIKKNRFEGEYQLYSRILDARTKLQNTETFTNMAKKSSLYAERFKLVEPNEYYTIISLIDTIEFIFRINKKKMIDKELWQRWENHAKGMMTIPKFKKVWLVTKEFHTPDFVNFMDAL